MKWFKRMLVVVVVAMWLPATMHCKLEELPGLQFLACCDHEDTAPHADNDCRSDSCALVEDGLYKSDNPKIEVPLPQLVALEIALPSEAPSPSLTVSSSFAPAHAPELSVTWQFSCRAAAPPRAPSRLS